MSGIYIPMEMPTSCYVCPCADLEFYDCNLMPGTRIEQKKRLDDCPLIPVPDHGRTIDGDVLCKVLQRNSEDEWNKNVAPFSWSYAYACVKDSVENMPTIIPASGGDAE